MFSALDLCLGPRGILLVLRRSAIDVVLDLLALVVLFDGIFTFFCADIPAVTAYGFFFAVQKLRAIPHNSRLAP